MGNKKIHEERKNDQQHDRIFYPMKIGPKGCQYRQGNDLLGWKFKQVQKGSDEKISKGMRSDQLESRQQEDHVKSNNDREVNLGRTILCLCKQETSYDVNRRQINNRPQKNQTVIIKK
jgi:hypothetical protein